MALAYAIVPMFALSAAAGAAFISKKLENSTVKELAATATGTATGTGTGTKTCGTYCSSPCPRN
jgi:hypothetical protein